VEGAPELQAAPQRIVSLAPSHTETLFAIGAGDRVVGVTDRCNYPPEASKLPRVSEFSKINVEAVIALEPDLVLAAHGNPGDEIRQIKDLGIPVYGVDPKTYDEAVEAIEALGALVGEEASAHEVAEKLRRAKADVAARVADLPPGDRPVVLICPMPPLELPLWVPGAHTYHDDMIRIVGGRNVVPEGLADWQPIGLESLVKAEPDIIIGPYPEGKDREEERERLERDLRRIDGFATMPALKTGRVHVMPEDPLFRPGPRLGDTIREMAMIVHPELYAGEDTP
jgi:iron complex transport system substrate-binding protein